MTVGWPGPPGTWRVTVAAVVVVAVTMAAWRWETTDWYWVAGGLLAVLVLLGWWRGLYVTTIARRRLALLVPSRRRRRREAPSATETTLLLRVAAESVGGELPLRSLAGFLDRYGIRCAATRVISIDRADDRLTVVCVTVRAADNLAALQARSPELRLAEMAGVVRRRLADELREQGWAVEHVDATAGPLPEDWLRERWLGVQTDAGFVAAYRVTVDDALPERLAEVRGLATSQAWTVLELAGEPLRPRVAVACAFVSAERPTRRSPLPGVVPHNGRHRRALEAMAPSSTKLLAGEHVSAVGAVEHLRWPVGSVALTA